MKTALQELKEQINHKLALFQNIEYDDLSLHHRGLLDAYINCKEWIKQLEEKEIDLVSYWENQYRLWILNGAVSETEGEMMQLFIKQLKSI